jgi:hypothetical protein
MAKLSVHLQKETTTNPFYPNKVGVGHLGGDISATQVTG